MTLLQLLPTTHYKPFLVRHKSLQLCSQPGSVHGILHRVSTQAWACRSLLEVLPDPWSNSLSLASPALALTTTHIREAQTPFSLYFALFHSSCSEWMKELSTDCDFHFSLCTAFSFYSVHFLKYWSPTSSAHPWCSAFWVVVKDMCFASSSDLSSSWPFCLLKLTWALHLNHKWLQLFPSKTLLNNIVLERMVVVIQYLEPLYHSATL